MPYKEFLDRVRRIFGGPSEHLDLIAESLAKGRLKYPVRPMSDQELARAIREFQKAPPSSSSLEKLGSDLSKEND